MADADAHPEKIAIALGELEAAMEEIEYPKLIKRILTEYIELCRPSQPEIETFLIADEQNGHYIWMNLGWEKGDRITDITV